jgi:hypothetical protein
MTLKKGTERKPQSPELAGGAGFTFEDAVGAFYLTALLGEGYAPGVKNRSVCRVGLQQRNFGEPLDDVVVDFRDAAGEEARLSLQVKSGLTVSAAKSNTDFREIIRDCWLTYQNPDFRKGVDRYGAAVGAIAKSKARALISLCELARDSVTTSHFDARFAKGGNASAALKTVKKDIVALLKVAKGCAPSVQEVHEFLAHLVLVEFDFLHAGASHTAEAMTRLCECLVTDQVGQTPLLWTTLCQMVRESAGKSGEYTRPRLVGELSHVVRLRAALSLRSDLEKLTALAKACVADIQNDVGGTHLGRPELAQRLEESIAKSRFVQIRGLPGSGKSVLLRQRVDADLARGPVMFLKSDRLEGKSWASFATANSLSGASLTSLLTEIAATGSDTLYIDGIDRVEKENQPIVLDLLRAILGSPLLNNWKIVVSLRDTGIEPLRNWLGEVLNSVSIGTVKVDALDDDEADVLAKAKPALRPLLFGPTQVREVVRRPFFAKVLYQSFATENSGPPFEPQSEVDLVENWWTRGGYNASGQEAIERQRAIIDISSIRARQLSQPVLLARLQPASVNQIDRLVGDGILQHVKQGHTVRFSHDIFFEWSFFHVLVERDDKWLVEVRQCGEPPAVARAVELLSQWEYKEGKSWTATLYLIAAAKMRSQWTRAWLLGPLGAATFKTNEAEFVNAITANNFALLKKALVWFQAEKTTPNANILASNLPTDQRIRAADLLGWPSDFAAWRRFIEFLLTRKDDIPVVLYPHIVSVFEVWQNALAGLRNPVSSALLTRCADWLRDIDARDARKEPTEGSCWKQLADLGDFRQSLCRLILRSASSMPALTEEYLKRVIGSERLRNEKFKEIVDFSPTLASTHPQLLVDLTLKHLREELPDDRVARERKEMLEAAEMRKKALAKPEAERTQRDNLIINGSHSLFGSHHFSYHDWETLSIDRDSQNFWPPSPLREPFHSLFKTAPAHALRLFTALCNHAVTAWRQLHRHDYERQATPLPLEIQFPWGVQQFWGGDREYLWHRGMWVPDALASGFLALEEWCFAELERGRPVDELIRQVVEGNQSVAILGIASMLALRTEQLSETVFPIVTAQRLWFADLNRMVQDKSHATTALMGFKPGDDAHVAAIKTASARLVRQKTLRWFVPMYVLSQEFGERIKAAILAFKDNLPFQLEEHKKDQAAHDHLMKQALKYAELALKENYRARRSAENEGMIEVVHVSPNAAKPEDIEQAERANLFLQQGNLWTWASKAFENGKVEDPATIPAAVNLAKKLDNTSLFELGDDEEGMGMRRGAVAATAAVVLQFREGRTAEERTWARDVLARAVTTPESRDGFWSPGSVIPWHQAIFVARGLAADVRNDTADTDAPIVLLSLDSHPLEIVALAALGEIATLWEKDAKMVWAALQLAFNLCRIDPRTAEEPRGPGGPIHSAERTRTALLAAVEYYEQGTGWPVLPVPPPAWVKVQKNAEPGERPDFEFDEDDVENVREAWTAPTTHWYSQYAAKVLQQVPIEKILASEVRGQFLTFITNALQWTNAKNSPPWLKKGRRNRESPHLYEWTHQLGATLGDMSGRLPLAEVKTRFLTPIFDLEGDTCWALLSPFASSFICRYIYDAQTVPDGAIEVVRLCLERFLKSPSFERSSYYAGEFHGFDEPRLVQILMFVSIERAGGAARYVNGDWSEIGMILPLVDRYVRASGWAATVMSQFLMLCERAKSAYPAEMFVDQILVVIGDSSEPLKGWNGTLIPARIAGLVQFFADRDTPMPSTLGQKLLRVLDLLVDMGDRRSAALQLSESFREIKIA